MNFTYTVTIVRPDSSSDIYLCNGYDTAGGMLVLREAIPESARNTLPATPVATFIFSTVVMNAAIVNDNTL